MTHERTYTADELKLMHAYERFCLAKGVCFLSFGVAAVVCCLLILDGFTNLHATTAVGVALLIAGGFADDSLAKAAKMAGTILILQLMSLAATCTAGDPVLQPQSDVVGSFVSGVTTAIVHAPGLFGIAGGLVGLAHLVLATRYIKRLAAKIASSDGKAIEA